MISKIFGFILNIINHIILYIFKIIFKLFNPLDITGFGEIFADFFELLTGTTKFLYFIIGPHTSIFITLFGLLWTTKHIALPVVNFIRKFLIK